ncbi:unnamed protein product [Closterium sp. NIES-53]
MEVARTSMIHAAAPHFLWPLAVQYAAEQLNLWSRVSHLETSPTLRWTGKVGDASAFRVWGSLSLVRDLPAGKLSPRTLRCVFLGFPTDAPPWQFYHPGSRRALFSCDVIFDKSVCFYRLHPHRSSPVPLPPLTLVDDPPSVAPLTPHGPAPSSMSQVDPPPFIEPLEVSSDTSGGPATSRQEAVLPERLREWAVQWGSPGGGSSRLRAGGAGTAGAGGAGTAGAGGSATGGTVVARTGGTGARRRATLSPERLREWAVQWGSPGGGASRACSPRAGGTGGTGGAATVGPAVGNPGARRRASLLPKRLCKWAVRWGSPGGGTGRAGAAGSGGASAGVLGTRGTGAAGGAGGSGSGGASPGGAGAGVPGTGGTGAAGGAGTGGGAGGAGTARGAGGAGTRGTTGGAVGGTGVSGASRQESLSPLQLREWAVRWGIPGDGAGGTRSGGAVATRAGGTGSRGATT